MAAMTAAYPKEQLNLYVSRIYRDARRLHGRGPYKDHLWFTIRPEQEGWTHVPAFYFEIAPEYHSLGMGYYGAEPVTMAKFRSRIDRDPALWRSWPPASAGAPICAGGRDVQTPQRGPRPPALSWYNRKNIALTWDRNCEGSLFTPELAGEAEESFRFLKPYYDYFLSLRGDPAPGCLPLIPAAPGIAPGGRYPFRKFLYFSHKTS